MIIFDPKSAYKHFKEDRLDEDGIRKAMAHPERLSIQSLTLEQALRRKWVDAKERVVWMKRFELASQALVTELKNMVLSKVAADAKPGRPRTPDKDRIF